MPMTENGLSTTTTPGRERREYCHGRAYHFCDNTGREWFASHKGAYLWLCKWLISIGRL